MADEDEPQRPRRRPASLYDVPGLEALEPVARKHDVSFKAIGSLPRRLLLFQIASPGAEPNLFDLVPFSSDIDLTHNGAPSKTPDIVRDIAYTLPFFELYRWQVASFEDWRPCKEFLEKSAHRIPDNRLTLDKNGLHDAQGAEEAYLERQVRFETNPDYDRSAFFAESRDIPVFAALMWCRNVLQAAGQLEWFSVFGQRAISDVRAAVLASEHGSVLEKLSQSGYLKSRLIYLLTAMALSVPRDERLLKVLEWLGVDRFLSTVIARVPDMEPRLGPVADVRISSDSTIVSATIGNAQFRAGPACSNWEIAETANARLHEVLIGSDAGAASDIALLASEPIPFEAGNATCAGIVKDEIHEFLHLHIPLLPAYAHVINKFDDADLSVAIALCSRHGETWSDLPGAMFVLPALSWYRYGDRREGSALQLRMNVFGIFSRATEIFAKHGFTGPLAFRVFVMRPVGHGMDQHFFRGKIMAAGHSEFAAAVDETYA